MKTALTRALGVVATGALALSLVAAHVGAETQEFVMNGAQETQLGDLGGEARARLSAPNGEELCLELEVTRALDANEVTGLHVHEAPRNQAGDVVVDFTGIIGEDFTGAVGDTIDGCVTNGQEDHADIVLEGRDRFTDEYYLNLHTDTFPAGAIRGQIKGQNYRPDEAPRGQQ